MNALTSRTLISNPSRIHGNLSSKSKQVLDRTRSYGLKTQLKYFYIMKIGRISPQIEKTCEVCLTLPGQRCYEMSIPCGVTSSRTKSGMIILSHVACTALESNRE